MVVLRVAKKDVKLAVGWAEKQVAYSVVVKDDL